MSRVFKKLRERILSEDGQATVEFALVLPILLMILCGIIDFGWLFYNQAMVNNACREGARFACVNLTTYNNNYSELQEAVEDNVASGLPNYLIDSSSFDVTVTSGTTAASPYDSCVVVTVKTNMPIFTPVLGTIHGSQNYDLSCTVSMKAES
jgi:Flp pilus assembly protein TadG